MGCSGPSKAANPTQKGERINTVEKDDKDERTFAEKINAIEINEDPHECIADLRMLRKTRELRPKGFLQRVMNKGKSPNISFQDEDEQKEKGAADTKKKQKNDSDDEYIFEDVNKKKANTGKPGIKK